MVRKTNKTKRTLPNGILLKQEDIHVGDLLLEKKANRLIWITNIGESSKTADFIILDNGLEAWDTLGNIVRDINEKELEHYPVSRT
jgi:hypothetical protein